MAKSPEEVAAAMIANLKEKAGKTLEAWMKLAKKSGCSKHGEIVKYLKTEHELTHGDPDRLTEARSIGAKARTEFSTAC